MAAALPQPPRSPRKKRTRAPRLPISKTDGTALPALPLHKVDRRQPHHHSQTSRPARTTHADHLECTRFQHPLRPPPPAPATTRTCEPAHPAPSYAQQRHVPASRKVWLNVNLYSTNGMWSKPVTQQQLAPGPNLAAAQQHKFLKKQRNLAIGEPWSPKLRRHVVPQLSFGATKVRLWSLAALPV